MTIVIRMQLDVAIIITFISIIGVPIGLLILVGYATVLLLGTVIVSLMVANWINNNYNHSWSDVKIIFAAFGIFIFTKLASLTPVIGPLIMFLMVCMAFGGVLQNIKWKRNRKLALT